MEFLQSQSYLVIPTPRKIDPSGYMGTGSYFGTTQFEYQKIQAFLEHYLGV